LAEKSGNAFDIEIFSRLMSFAKKYKLYFFIASTSTILLALFSVLSPYILINTVDQYILSNDKVGLLNYTLLMLGILLIEVLLQFTFIYFANWVGQHIIRDIRAKIFRHILQFKLSYFDTNSVGKLVSIVVCVI
jgi:subfamily B ATP-binding cassette protein MsbA